MRCEAASRPPFQSPSLRRGRARAIIGGAHECRARRQSTGMTIPENHLQRRPRRQQAIAARARLAIASATTGSAGIDAIRTSGRLSASPWARLAARLADRELLQLVPALEQRAQPARRRSTSRPGLGPVVRIAIFRRDLAPLELAATRLGAAFCAMRKAEALDCRKLLLQLTTGRRGFFGNHPNDVITQDNQIIERHRLELQASHQSSPTVMQVA